MPPRFPGLFQAPPLPDDRQYDQPPAPATQADKLSAKTSLNLPEIPLLKNKEDFTTWLYFVQAALDYDDLTQLINPNLDRPEPTNAGYKNWHKQAMRVSSWMRLHISEDLARRLVLVHKPNMYPDELICAISQSLFSTHPGLLGNKVYEVPRRSDYYTRSQYILDLWSKRNYSFNHKVPVDMYQMVTTMLDTLEPEIPIVVAAQRQELAQFSDQKFDETKFDPMLHSLVSATE